MKSKASHKHRAAEIVGQYCWQSCVAYHKQHDQRAHGNIRIVHKCRCGALRSTESNAGVVVYGEWR